jgi:hypothetical protein
MQFVNVARRAMVPRSAARVVPLAAAGLMMAGGCTHSTAAMNTSATPESQMSANAPNPDPRVGLKAGLNDAGQALWNMKQVSFTPPSEKFVHGVNSDLAFTGHYVIQGSFNGFQVWDITDPSKPVLTKGFYCPASQSDVSVYKNLLFVSSEGLEGRLDCAGTGDKDTVSAERVRGVRIFDITDITNPKYVANVQTCRGSHTHTLLVDPKDPDDVYVYISGSAPVRSPNELQGCSGAQPGSDPNTALFRIEVIKVPLAHPEQAAIVSSPRIFNDLVAPARHGETKQDVEKAAKIAADARAKGAFTADIFGVERVLPPQFIDPMLDSIVKTRSGTGAPTAADSATLRTALPSIIAKMLGEPAPGSSATGPRPGPTQCHDITVYPAVGFAGGACEGYGMLLDIHDPVNPTRLYAASDSNFSYWHSATFNNDGTKVLFSDEWGGGGQPKCRATDPQDWGADAIFTISNNALHFQSYYKMPAPQTEMENCVAHNGSLIPIPGRDVMVQSWYQGGISVFDWTDAAHPKEIAVFDRGPIDSTRMMLGGTWSAYWYNGVIVSSEIVRGLDILELTPSVLLSQNEIDAAKTVHLDYLNVQGQPKYVWPATFVLARAYVDQLERSNGLSAARITAVRKSLADAEQASGSSRQSALTQLASQLDSDAGGARDGAKVKTLAGAVHALAGASQ